MTQEDKNLLLQDLCARLPYGVKISVNDKVESLQGINILDNVVEYGSFLSSNIEEVKSYLYPLSSMTEEQRKEFLDIQSEDRKRLLDALIKYRYEEEDKIPIIPLQKHIDWLNAHHFDYRGLIPKGLANDATGLNLY